MVSYLFNHQTNLHACGYEIKGHNQTNLIAFDIPMSIYVEAFKKSTTNVKGNSNLDEIIKT